MQVSPAAPLCLGPTGLVTQRSHNDLGSRSALGGRSGAIMPVSAYLQAAAFVILAGVALFAAAGTVAILTFWIYLAIFAAIVVAAFVWLDPGLLRERMRPGDKPPPLALQLFTLIMFLHWIVAGLDRGRFHWSDSVPVWLQAVALVVLAAGYVLCFWAMAVNRFFSCSQAASRSAHGSRLRSSWSAACRSCCTGRSPKTASCRPTCRAIARMRRGFADGWCRGSGDPVGDCP